MVSCTGSISSSSHNVTSARHPFRCANQSDYRHVLASNVGDHAQSLVSLTGKIQKQLEHVDKV